MRGVFLDRESLDQGDMDFSSLDAVLPGWRDFDYTESYQTQERVGDAEVVISNKVLLSKDVLQNAKFLKLICVAATGTNNVDVGAAKTLNIPVTNVRAYATPSVAEHVFAMILSLSRHLADYQKAAVDGSWQHSRQFCVLGSTISELAGKTLGIVGYGELGKRVAGLAKAFGMEVLIARRPGGGGGLSEGRLTLQEMLPKVDVLSLHCPLTEQTRNLIGSDELRLMKSGAILINTARGGIVNEHALVDALHKGMLGGAGVDVITEEPPTHGHMLLGDVPNLIVTPHVAWASRQSRQRLVEEIAKNIKAFRSGEVRNRVA